MQRQSFDDFNLGYGDPKPEPQKPILTPAQQKEADRVQDHQDLNKLKNEVTSLKSQLKSSEIVLQKFQQAMQESDAKKELDRLKISTLDTLLLDASAAGELERIKHLLALDANINTRNVNGHTPLLLSMQNKHRKVVDFLLTKNPDLTAVDSAGNNLIECMAMTANIEMLLLLIEQHSKVNEVSLLMRAYNKTKALKTDEYVNVRQMLANYMLRYSVKQGKLDDVRKALCEFNAEINNQDSSLETALHRAAYFSHLEIVDLILYIGAKTTIQNSSGQTAIQVASGENKDTIIRLFKHYELLRCVQKHDKDGLEKLIIEHVDLGLNNFNLTEDKNLLVVALRLSKSEKRIEIIQLLLNNGMNVNILSGKSTPLHIAVLLDDKEAIKLLIKAGARKDNKNTDGQTAVEFARANNKAELADYMIEKFAKEKTKMKHGIVSTSSFTKFGNAEGVKQEAEATKMDVLDNTIVQKPM